MEGSIVLITTLKGSKLKRHVCKTTGANRFLIYRRCKFNIRLYVYKLSNFEIKKGKVKILTSDKMSIKNNNSILNWRCFYWAFCKMITSIWYNVTVSGRWNRTTQLISWSSYTKNDILEWGKYRSRIGSVGRALYYFFPSLWMCETKKQQQ